MESNLNREIEIIDLNRLMWLSDELHVYLTRLKLPSTYPEIILAKVKSTFLGKSESERKGIIKVMQFYCDLCEEASKKGLRPENNIRFTWLALNLLNLRPPSNLFEYIGSDDCVEIYDANGTQCYRDINFCRLVSYSIQESLVFTWDVLYSREDSILQTMHQEAGYALTQTNKPFASKIPVHRCHEISSQNRRKYEVKFKTISPLFDEKFTKTAFLVTSNLTVLGDQS